MAMVLVTAVACDGSESPAASEEGTTASVASDTMLASSDTASVGDDTTTGAAEDETAGVENDPLEYHDGYWVADLGGATLINDMHIDLETRRATVYAQLVASGMIVSPPQVGPGECTTFMGNPVCFHPNAVYLDGSGAELEAADGPGTGGSSIRGSWTVKAMTTASPFRWWSSGSACRRSASSPKTA